MKNIETSRTKRKQGGMAGSLLSIMVMGWIMAGCMVYAPSISDTIDRAVSVAVEREVERMMAGYTDVMMFQLAYTQTFFIGGYGFVPDEFDVGQGATWRVESVDRDEVTSFTAERALLTRESDGSSWWYLKFHADDTQPVEYEILLTPDLEARKMYIRDHQSGDIRYHEFAHDESEAMEVEEGDETLEEVGYQTNFYYLEAWDQYRDGSEEITVGAGTFHTDVLNFSPVMHEEEGWDDERFEYRWWISQNVPGHLVRFEYRDLEEDGVFQGELVELRSDYRPRFVEN